jgi:hypothetical protein
METPPLKITVKAKAELVKVPKPVEEPKLVKVPKLVKEPKLVALSITSDKRELTAKETTSLRASAKYSNNRVSDLNDGLTWESKNPDVATIDSAGKVSARRAGQVEFVVRHGGIVSGPLALSIKSPAETLKTDPRPTKAAAPALSPSVDSQLENARRYLDQGQYNEALKELAQANRNSPGNKQVQTAIADAKRACSAEKRLGRADLKC